MIRYSLETNEITNTIPLFISGGNKPLDNKALTLMNYYKKIIFNHDFNQKIDNLPSHIEYLEFGEKFNQSINNLPINLKTLILGYEFNQSLAYLPIGLLILNIEYCNFKDTLDVSNIPISTTIQP